MHSFRSLVQAALAVILACGTALICACGPALAQAQPPAYKRIALVVGNGAYQGAPALRTAVKDAALVAETLRAAEFGVIELQDATTATLMEGLRVFLDYAERAGSDGVALFYFSGYAVQSGGEAYFAPVEAQIANDVQVAQSTFRLNELMQELAKLQLASRVVILDAARNHQFGKGQGTPLALGLPNLSAPSGFLLASAAAPGAISTDGDGPYSLYTATLVTQMRQPGLDLAAILAQTQQQVSKATNGLQQPWIADGKIAPVRFFAPAAAAVQATQPDTQSEPDVVGSRPDTLVASLQAAGYQAELTKDNIGNPKIQSRASGYSFQIYFYGCKDAGNCTQIKFSAGFTKMAKGKPAADKINDWNRNKVMTKAWVDTEGDPYITYGLSLREPMSQARFRELVAIWDSSLGEFAKTFVK